MNKCNPKKRRAYILVSDCDVFAIITSIHRLRKVITKTIIPAICLFIDYLFMLAANGHVYETFVILKRFPIKPLLCLLNVPTLKLALSAKCFIYGVVCWPFFFLPGV